MCPVDLSTSENTEAENYILEQKCDAKIFSLYSKKAEDTGPIFKNKHFLLAFQGLILLGLPIRPGSCEAQHQHQPRLKQPSRS